MDIKNKETLKNLFNKALYLQIIVLPEPRRNPVRMARFRNMDMETSSPLTKRVLLSPNSRKLLESFSPDTQTRLAEDFKKDEEYIQKTIGKLELDDPNYVNFNNSKVGTDLEYWVCVNMTCPGCNGTLYKYANPSMPAVDVRCINPNHTLADGPKYYQIKATEKDRVYNGYKYFSDNEQYICVGSVRFGYNCHVMTYNDEYKDILVGYICLEYTYINDTNIRIDTNKSFILIPNLLFIPKNDEEKLWTYYSYIKKDSSPIITFNPNMVTISRLSPSINDKVSLTIMYDAKKIKMYETEPPAVLDFKSKYLIMKMKYLNLKNKIKINIL